MAAQVTIYNNDPTNVTVTVLSGDPPVDQSALVAQLQQQVADLTAQNAALTAQLGAAKTDAQASVVAAQKVVTDLGG